MILKSVKKMIHILKNNMFSARLIKSLVHMLQFDCSFLHTMRAESAVLSYLILLAGDTNTVIFSDSIVSIYIYQRKDSESDF